MDKTNPRVGTIAFKNGFGSCAKTKNKTITKYVSIAIVILRKKLVSQALSISTRLLRSWMFSISFSKFVIVVCHDINGGSSKTNFEPTAKRFDPILDKVLSELKNYLSSVSLSKVEEFHKDVSIST